MKIGQIIISKLITPEKLRDVLITRTAIKTLQSEALVERIISFQFKDANEATKIYNEVEISGFGKFMLSARKARKKIEKLGRINDSINNLLTKEDITDKEIISLGKKKANNNVVIAYLKTKLERYENGCKGDNGGSLELSICEAGDREDSKREE